ncbi:MAG TPA: hypothetical protein VF024_11180 [Solirubrobacteraceae bacterium]
MASWERGYLAWHVATDHPWDLALQVEATDLEMAGIGREIGERLRPVIDAAAISIAEFGAALARIVGENGV